MAARHFGQPQAVRLNQPETGFARTVCELAHAGVAPGNVEEHLLHRFGGGFDAHANSVETEKHFRGRRHGRIITASQAHNLGLKPHGGQQADCQIIVKIATRY
jgi:hypothetical protein